MKKDKCVFPALITFNPATINFVSTYKVISVTDLTVIKPAQEEKIKVEKLQSIIDVAATICHELNQPLHAILGYCELLMSGDESDFNEIKQILSTITQQIDRIKKITKKLTGITEYKQLKYSGDNKLSGIWSIGNNNGK